MFEEWATFKTPMQPSEPRRPSYAPDGKIWFSENIADRIGILDAETGKITECKSPFKYGGEYECFPDPQGAVWVTLRAYETLAKFNLKIQRYTYHPNPVPKVGGRIPKVKVEAQGNVGGPSGVRC